MQKQVCKQPICMTIIRDSQEKLPYDFASIVRPVLRFTVEDGHLKTGDYTVRIHGAVLPDDNIVIERKTLADLYTTLGQRRKQFEAEFQRMSLYGHAALVLEAGLEQIALPSSWLSHPSQLHPKSVFGTLFAWSQRYGVHVWPCPGRRFAEQATFRMLERWVRDRAAMGLHAVAQEALN